MTKDELIARVEQLEAELTAKSEQVTVLETELQLVREQDPAITLRDALAEHLGAAGVHNAPAEALTVLAHLADVARHSTRFGEATVRALMALPE